MLFGCIHDVSCPQEVKLGPNSKANFSKTAESKRSLSTFGITARDTHHIKKKPNHCILQRVIAKKKVPYQMSLEERYITFRAKIEHQNNRKRYIKCTYSESTSEVLFKTLLFVVQFKASRCQWSILASGAKIEGKLLANFSKMAEQKTLSTALAEIRIILNEAQSVHSTRSYSKK